MRVFNLSLFLFAMIITSMLQVIGYYVYMKKYIISSAIALFFAGVAAYIAFAGANISPV